MLIMEFRVVLFLFYFIFFVFNLLDAILVHLCAKMKHFRVFSRMPFCSL